MQLILAKFPSGIATGSISYIIRTSSQRVTYLSSVSHGLISRTKINDFPPSSYTFGLLSGRKITFQGLIRYNEGKKTPHGLGYIVDTYISDHHTIFLNF